MPPLSGSSLFDLTRMDAEVKSSGPVTLFSKASLEDSFHDFFLSQHIDFI